MNRPAAAFTLIELLVVVAVIAILAAIAVPNFLEAQVRAKVSAARSNQRVVVGALAAYQVDAGTCPGSASIVPADTLGILAEVQLRFVTSPVAYISSGAMRDPFGTARLYSLLPSATSGSSFTSAFPPNENRSLLYYHYESMASALHAPQIAMPGWGLVSIGPDLEDSLGAFCRLPADVFRSAFVYSQIQDPITTLYDPTNGSVSKGDLVWLSNGAPWGAP